MPWDQFAGLTWQYVFVSRMGSKGLRVERRDGLHVTARLIAVGLTRHRVLADYAQTALDHYRVQPSGLDAHIGRSAPGPSRPENDSAESFLGR